MSRGRFSETLSQIDADALSGIALTASPRDVEASLLSENRDLQDLAVLLSSAAGTDYLEPLARAAGELTTRRFGKTIHMFAPLYISNECVSTCTYCGFSKENQISRTTLTPQQAVDEAEWLLSKGFRHLLLVSGEHARIVSPDYLVSVIEPLAERVPQLSLEVQTWDEETYARLVDAGCDGIVVYQETYDRAAYAGVHLRGRKRNFASRLDALDRAATGGARRLGAGVLLGLSNNWRAEVIALGAHALWLSNQHYRCEISIALPRLRPCAGGLEQINEVTDREYAQAIAALRLLLPDAAIVLSTREAASLRDGLIRIGVTHMSAGSQTEPGGYIHSELEADPQFEIEDRRSVADVAAAIADSGYEPVWKDWARV